MTPLSPAVAEYLECWHHGPRSRERSDGEKARAPLLHEQASAYLQSLVLDEMLFYDQVHQEAVFLLCVANGATVSHRLACGSWEAFYGHYTQLEATAKAACFEQLRILEQYVIKQKRLERKPL